ncbi:unknown [Clostridium sp. CAG:967]|nr:unknown [Clostridium sp. CAG:967]
MKKYDAFILPESATHVALLTDVHRCAFTLAEVLITLGIIGVVAALTMPSLIQNKQKKELETAFKKSYANFYNAYNKAKINEPPLWDDTDLVNPYPEIAKAIYKEYIKIENINNDTNKKYLSKVRTYTFEKAVLPECSQLFRNEGSVITPDGSAISVSQNCYRNWVIIDTNGINKGPNAYGHDIFSFNIYKTGIFGPTTSEAEGNYDENGNPQGGYNNSPEAANKCSPSSKSKINGITCSQFALSNTCPYDDKKTYWECLP